MATTTQTEGSGRWWRLHARMERLHAEALRLDGIDDDRSWRCTEIAGDVNTVLLNMPAPDIKAALYKYDYFTGIAEGQFDEADGSTPSWSAAALRLAIFDVRRFIAREG